ncbi:uncharacterized protein sS8_4161 [Methylocaldum marinum]|uniref:Uncharacterized protein n=1 Tax=Methylocaldum marinum TaxID=1432792 RepID=A0A250KYM6_9GAMM|nr:hypothetical protein [Methylocaldum marinum]BBA36091.1 uncharacterized protein sS8_4161 [Methylocaldum marinum]
MIKCCWRVIFPVTFLVLQSAATVAEAESTTVLAKAVVDECWNGCGMPYIAASANGACPSDTLPKRNQAYVWGLTRWNQNVWIGTGPNIAGIASTVGGGTQECALTYDPSGRLINVLEGGLSQYPGVPEPLRGFLGDWRTPQVWIYDTETKTRTNVTPNDSLINQTLGLRAAGAANGVILLAGPGRLGVSVNMFAFDAETKEYLGSRSFARYANIRKFVPWQGVVYTGVQTLVGSGEILRWSGTRADPFSFTTVGIVDNDAVNLAVHEERLFVATWRPSTMSSSVGILFDTDNPPAGIWMSPPIPAGGLRVFHAGLWTKVWEVTNYEVDDLIASTQGVGDLASFAGYLYWGHMNPPWSVYNTFVNAYGEPANPEETRKNLWRAIPIFRGRNFASSPEIELLYGETQLPKYDGNAWQTVNNRLGGATPRFGASGFDVPTNVYTWTMAVFDGRLWVGTLDSDFAGISSTDPGADLWVFPDGNSKAEAWTVDGFGHPETAGVRTMIPSNDTLFVGTSSRANLSPDGGWKLIGIKP